MCRHIYLCLFNKIKRKKRRNFIPCVNFGDLLVDKNIPYI